MKTVTLDGREMPDQAAFHDLAARKLGFPEWYGRNLDALYDCLCDIGEDTQVMFSSLGEMQASLGPYTQELLAAFLDAQEENEHLFVALLDEED